MVPIFIKIIDTREPLCPEIFIYFVQISIWTWDGFNTLVTDPDVLEDSNVSFVIITPFTED